MVEGTQGLAQEELGYGNRIRRVETVQDMQMIGNMACVSLCVALGVSNARNQGKVFVKQGTGGDPTSRIPAHESTAVAAPFRA